MLTEEFGVDVFNYWDHWKQAPSFSDISKKTRGEIESLLKNISKFAKKHKVSPNDLEILKFLVSNLLKLAELISIEKWDEIIDTNLRSAFLCSREVAKIMKEHVCNIHYNVPTIMKKYMQLSTKPYKNEKNYII